MDMDVYVLLRYLFKMQTLKRKMLTSENFLKICRIQQIKDNAYTTGNIQKTYEFVKLENYSSNNEDRK